MFYDDGIGYTFTWNGKQLASAGIGYKTYYFSYNDQGLKTGKYSSGNTTYYYYEGDRLIAENAGEYIILYVYDASGSPIGMQYRQNTDAAGVFECYWYEKNLQGDVVAVYNSQGTKLASYRYTAYGDVYTTYYNGGSSTGAAKNPFKYRGYYYDSDLQLYYLRSRYYDPRTCRFISPDDISYLGANGDLLSYNLYAYCSNDPVNYVDPSGHFVELAAVAISATAIAALAVSLVLLVYDATHEQRLGNAVSGVIDAAAGYINEISDKYKRASKDAEKDVAYADDSQNYNYWTASIVDGIVTPGEPLTYSQARAWVASENNLLCANHSAAIAVVKFYPSAYWEAAHRGGLQCGYLNHYHLSSAHSNHIWYYGE